jgi:bile acid:Na+ symporter, BASS family
VKYLPAIAVFLLMVSTGMSLDRREFIANWRRFTPGLWARLLLATFIVPPAMALVLGRVLPIDLAAMGGLYLIAVAPGAPLMTRNAAKRGFDMQLAASYQVWGALVAPIAIPMLIGAGAWLAGRQVWISPLEVLAIVAQKQFAPLLAGMALLHFAPVLAAKMRRPLNVAGNLVLTVALIALLIKLGPVLMAVSKWVAIAALALAATCISAARVLIPTAPTLAISNVNRQVGLALLLSFAHFQNAQRALPRDRRVCARGAADDGALREVDTSFSEATDTTS